MAEVEVQKRSLFSRDTARRAMPDDYRPVITSLKEVAADSIGVDESDPPIARSADRAVSLRKLQQQLAREPLDEIATLMQGLTFGEMIEFAQTMWKAQPEGSAITQENLSFLMHRWSTLRSASENLGPSPS
jgi:hypothetical protein